MKNDEIRGLTVKELEERIENEEAYLLKLRLNHAISPLDNPLKIKEIRRNVARLRTELHQRQLAETQKK
ncbi:MAG: 50S ribosomal protein L29 [Chlorobi bacterium]|nr:50S ribosomal protein L29 [Chlorobiota bacterium]